MLDLCLRDVRIVPLDAVPAGSPSPDPRPVDVLLRDGRVAQVGPGLTAPGVPELDGAGRWALPGLWDQHVHMVQWGLRRSRLDTAGTTDSRQVLDLVVDRLRTGPPSTTGVLIGWGHRSAGWPRQPTVAELDAVSGPAPVVLISGDGHHGWLNSAALRLLGGPAGTTGIVAEEDWFALYDRLGALPGAAEAAEEGVAAAVADAHGLGVTGIVDLEFGRPWAQWRARSREGTPPLRARVGVYPEGLAEVLDAGVRTGDPVRATDGLVTMGPLKIISDGSLNTRTAWCCQPYADGARLAHPSGAPNVSPQELTELLSTAHRAGLQAAVHAIGDAAVRAALDAFAASGAHGSVEHAQLVDPADLARWARLPVRASVQPAHLLDDRVVTEQCWPDRTGRTFTLRSFHEAGIPVVLGSDAPVSPLDPWLAMAAAVHRGPAGGPSWHPEQELSPLQALAASVDGQRLSPGHRGDVVLLQENPLPGAQERRGGRPDPAAAAARLRRARVSATVLDAQVVYGG